MGQPEGVVNHCMEQPEVGSRRLHRTARIYVTSVLKYWSCFHFFKCIHMCVFEPSL